VIGLTAYGNRDLARAYDLGINFYLLKPVEANSLADVLEALDLYQG
jgi:CheY-like chemotaxis protein